MSSWRELIERPTWMESAACRGAPVAMFFLTQGESLKPAKTICRTCPVRAECLAYAVNTNEMHGTWGGLGERQRQRVRTNHRNELIADGNAGLRGPLRAARSTPS